MAIDKKNIYEKIQVATFLVDSKLFGIPIEDVLEINKNLEITPAPLAPPFIDGVINLRGQIVPAVNLKKRLGIELRSSEGNASKHNLIIGTRNNSVSLLVDEIGDVLEISSEIIEAPPETIKGIDITYVMSVCKLKGELMVILDSKKLQLK